MKRYTLFADTELATPQGHEVLENGVPKKRFKKDIIATGAYTHPATGRKFEITPDTLNEWSARFERMKSAKVTVPVLTSHWGDTEATVGPVIDMSVEGDRLYMTFEAVGEDRIADVYRTPTVSIGVIEELTTGEGDRYGEVIEHVALTNFPVYSHQEEMKELFLSSKVMDRVKDEEATVVEDEIEDPPVVEEVEETEEEPVKFSVSPAERQLGEIHLTRLTDSGTCNPAVVKELRAMTDKNPELLKLEDDGNSLLSTLVELLLKNKSVILGEQTVGQEHQTVMDEAVERLSKKSRK